MTQSSATIKTFGMTETQFALLSDLLIRPLQQAGAMVWIFGSRARGDQKPASDVDILYEFQSGMWAPSGLIFTVKSNIEDSRFPFLVDLVQVQDLAPAYRENILRERVLL